MADWQEAAQASVIAFLFALMVAKLVSVVISFRAGNLRVERGGGLPPQPKFLSEEGSEPEEDVEEEAAAAASDASSFSSSESVDFEDDEDRELEYKDVSTAEDVNTGKEDAFLPGDGNMKETADEEDPGIAPSPLLREKNSSADAESEDGAGNVTPPELTIIGREDTFEVSNEEIEERIERPGEGPGGFSDSEEWEGVETSELDEKFDAAATFVATQTVGSGLKVPNETRLLLYGLYKLATEGPCTGPQPSAYKLSARAKWYARVLFVRPTPKNAWQKLGTIGAEEAMHRYIALVSDISPGWAQSDKQADTKAGGATKDDVSGQGGMGPVFSSLARSEEGVTEEGTLETIHTCAREGDQSGLQQQIEIGTPVDLKDSDGRTALHWAADRGHLQAVELLLAKGAQIHAKDSEGQTALHYAATCEHEGIAKYLVANGAEPGMLDNDGVSPTASCPAHWFWIGRKSP